MRKQGSSRRSFMAATVFSLAAAILVSGTPGAFADPSSDSPDTANIQELTDNQKQQIGEIEAQLADLRAKQNEAQLKAEYASENFNRALDELDAAKETADQAKVAETAANQERDQARTEIAKLIMAVYRDRSLSLAPLKPYMEADGLHNMEVRRRAVQKFGADADKKIQHYDAAEAVAKVLHGEALKNVKQQQAAVDKVEAERAKAATIAQEAEDKVSALEKQRGDKIAELARLRQVSIEQEQKRQAELEAAAEARAEAAARKRAEEELARARAQAQEVAKREAAAKAAREKEAAQKAKASSSTRSENNQKAKAAAAKAAQDKAAREQAAREKAARDKAARDKAAREQAARDKAARAKAAQSAAKVNPNAPVSSKAQGALAWAKQNLGIPYVWGGASSRGYDCSGFTQAAWRSQGVRLSHSSRMQYLQGTRVPLDKAAPGDLLFWSSNGSQGSIYHVAIYMGNGMMMEAPRPGYSTMVAKVRYRGIMPYVVRLG